MTWMLRYVLGALLGAAASTLVAFVIAAAENGIMAVGPIVVPFLAYPNLYWPFPTIGIVIGTVAIGLRDALRI